MNNNELETALDDWLTPRKEALEQARAFETAIRNSREKVFRVFTSPEGKELLDEWHELFLLTPAVTPTSSEFSAGLLEGEKNMVRYILTALKEQLDG